ncbi:MAG: DNA mismatch repair endonuclease MutL [Candidatus Aminicenantes bacterium]|jgi:DNA mismatch repair protein MutL
MNKPQEADSRDYSFRIRVLPAEISQKIAAGEVIERPFSIVKELVENSLDALSTDVKVDLKGGGKSQIRVTDNGRGMRREDAEIAFERHSTSKISEESDLERIDTLGFRGEALPSISAVSRVILKTNHQGGERGTLIEREGENLLRVSDVGFPKGTSVEVRDLFFNLPARRKFLRSDRSELNQIVRYLTQVTLAHHNVGFSLSHEGRAIFNYPPVNTLIERIFQVYGKSGVENLIEIQHAEGEQRLFGYASRPPSGRKDRKRQLFYVNGRLVKDKVLMAALNRAYSSFLEKDLYPEAYLFLAIPPADVDVNVHPAKTEVRFVNSSSVFRLVTRGLERSLLEGLGVKAVYPAEAKTQTGGRIEEQPHPPIFPDFRSEAAKPSFELFPQTGKETSPSPRILGQYMDLYIIVADEEGIRIIDQHNAHERILFERYAAINRTEEWPRKQALLPLLFDLSASEEISLEENRHLLEGAGFRVDAMGGRSFALKEYPDIFTEEEAKDIFLSLLEEISASRIEDKQDALLATLACKTAIKAGEILSFDKMAYLVEELEKTKNSSLCPHGRPIQVKIDLKTIEKGLKRK